MRGIIVFRGMSLVFNRRFWWGRSEGVSHGWRPRSQVKDLLGGLVWIKFLEFIEENGDAEGTVILKSDQELAMELLVSELVEARPDGRAIVEGAPKQIKGSNGVVERAAQEIEGGIRSLFLGLEERLGRHLDVRERIVAFMPEYASYVLNRLSVGQDGLVAYERIRGKKPTVLGLEFGEKLAYMKATGDKLNKLKSRWGLGI